jgi:hypothetical protein
VFAENGLPQNTPLAKGERTMLDLKKLHTFYSELQQPSGIEANTRKAPAREIEKDTNAQLSPS